MAIEIIGDKPINRITYVEYLKQHPGDPYKLMDKFAAHKNVYSVQCRELPGTYVLSPLYKRPPDNLFFNTEITETTVKPKKVKSK